MRASRSLSPENDVFAISDSIVPDRVQKQAGTTEVDFDGLLSSPLRLHEDLREGCGGQLWPAGMVLAKYMLIYHQDLNDKHIIEIGAGGGLVALAVTIGCKTNEEVLVTDQIPMLQLMLQNIALNRLTSKVQAQVYDWGSKPIPIFSTRSRHPDIVLAADCVYFEPAFPLLIQTLKDLIGPSTTCFFCFKKRRKADMRFIRDMKKTFEVQEVDYEDRDKDRRDTIFLYSLGRKSQAAA